MRVFTASQRSENCRVVNLFVNFSEKAKQVVIMFLRLMHNYLHSDSLRETKSVNLNFLLFIIHIMKLLSKPVGLFFWFLRSNSKRIFVGLDNTK